MFKKKFSGSTEYVWEQIILVMLLCYYYYYYTGIVAKSEQILDNLTVQRRPVTANYSPASIAVPRSRR